jgi:hypothetical protein
MAFIDLYQTGSSVMRPSRLMIAPCSAMRGL